MSARAWTSMFQTFGLKPGWLLWGGENVLGMERTYRVEGSEGSGNATTVCAKELVTQHMSSRNHACRSVKLDSREHDIPQNRGRLYWLALSKNYPRTFAEREALIDDTHVLAKRLGTSKCGLKPSDFFFKSWHPVILEAATLAERSAAHRATQQPRKPPQKKRRKSGSHAVADAGIDELGDGLDVKDSNHFQWYDHHAPAWADVGECFSIVPEHNRCAKPFLNNNFWRNLPVRERDLVSYWDRAQPVPEGGDRLQFLDL